MKMAICPVCKTVHEATGQRTLRGADERRTYRITHCRLCESPSTGFHPLPNQPDLADDELGYPMAVVPWIEAEGAQVSASVPGHAGGRFRPAKAGCQCHEQGAGH